MRKLSKIVGLTMVMLLSLTTLASAAFAGPTVWDAKVNLNIRTGPGLSYAIIITKANDSDLPQYSVNYPDDLAPVTADGYSWGRVCYASSGYGKYYMWASGYAAWYPIGSGTRYYNYVTNCKVIGSSSISIYKYSNLTTPYSGSYAPGTYFGGCPMDATSLSYAPSYPNSWWINPLTGSLTSAYADGWHLNAGPDN